MIWRCGPVTPVVAPRRWPLQSPLRRIRDRGLERGLGLELTPTAVNALAAEGYDPQYGARPLKRVIQQRLENPIATRLLAGEFKEDDVIEVDWQREQFQFERKASAVAAG